MTPAAFSPDVREFLRLLHERAVRYVLVGGEAVIFHGYARLTGDTDVFFDRANDNCARLFAALTAFWGGDVPGVSSADELARPGSVIMFGRPPHRIDLVNEIDGVSFAEAWASHVAVEMPIEERPVTVRYVGLELLLRNKRAAGRPKDLQDVLVLDRALRRKR
jgi:hypothetical protein